MSTSTKDVCITHARTFFMYSVISVVITDCPILFMASDHSYTEFINIVIVVSTIMVINPGTQMARVLYTGLSHATGSRTNCDRPV